MIKAHLHINQLKTRIGVALISVAASLAGCTEEAPGPKSMEFAASDYAEQSRAATAIHGDRYALHASAMYRYPGKTPIYYFGSQTLPLAYNASTERFVATNYYYPLTGEMDMVAYGYTQGLSPQPTATLTNASPLSSTSLNFRKITAVFPANSTEGKWELIYSDPITVDCATATENLSLCFHHSMTNLRFHFEPEDELSCSHIEINSILVENVPCTGKFMYDYTTSTATWSDTISTNHYVHNLTSHKLVWAEGGLDAGNGIYIVPKAKRTRIIINYTMVNDLIIDGNLGNGSPDTNRRTMNYIVNDDYSLSWDLGCQYIYNIRVRANYQMELKNVDVQLVESGVTGTMNI